MTTTRMRTTMRLSVAAALAAALLLTGCGDDDGDGEDADDTPTTEATSPATDAEDEATGTSEGDGGEGAGETVEVTLVDYAFEGLPDTVPAGTRLTIVNDSEAELHELVAIRIPDEETRPVSELVTLPDEEIDAIFGDAPPATVLLAPPGGEQVDAVGDGTLSEPGRYAVVCFIPTGVDPEAYLNAPPSDGPPEVPGADGPPHAAHGMWAELAVE